MRLHRPVFTLAVLLSIVSSHLTAQGTTGRAALTPIVGVWQSDTTNGNSALSDCVWTPQGGAVLCEQTITTPGGMRHAENLFTWDSTTSRYFLYVAQAPGDTLAPVPLAIAGKIWTYGGLSPAPNGKWWRTINDFSATGSYAWRLESSDDGSSWTRVMGGTSRRVRRR